MESTTFNGHLIDQSLHVPPNNPDAEVALLGSLLYLNEAIEKVDFHPDHFYYTSNQIVAQTIATMWRGGCRALDVVTLGDELQRTGHLEEVGGFPYLVTLAESVPHAEHARYYADIVREKYQRRQLIRQCELMVSEARRPDSNIGHVVEHTANLLRECGLGEQKSRVRSFKGIDASELASYAKQEPDWLVKDIFTIDEPLLFGARSKGCKTLQLTDLAVAVASGTKWMDVFDVPKQRKVLFISGETNRRRIAKHIEKACRARGLSFNDLSGFLRIEAIDFPCLPRLADQESIRADIETHEIELVIVDPLYRGLSGIDSSRLSEMGDAIKSFQAACQPACTALSHHVIKSAAREYGNPPQLEDMTGAGIAESCGQWWLVGRNEKYQWDWKHDLCIQFGGREGQGGGRRILFNEQHWTFQVEPWSEFIEEKNSEEQQKRDDARCEALERKRASARALILKAVRNIKTPQSKTAIEGAAGAVQTAFRYVFGEMVREQTLVQRPYRDSQNRIQAAGYLLNDYVAEYDKSAMLVDAG